MSTTFQPLTSVPYVNGYNPLRYPMTRDLFCANESLRSSHTLCSQTPKGSMCKRGTYWAGPICLIQKKRLTFRRGSGWRLAGSALALVFCGLSVEQTCV
ncbi:hypothetical protein Taro_010690 [Colocasia esculenta]|uniref:Uncharacterized protein n=1 Tax=Colocasia esculenta TaxID=4460 RepID=A0A843UDU4_COLES|nr:hypothetical protein [Colocasia esculenta]